VLRAIGYVSFHVEIETTDDWSDEETDDPLYADQRNFYKVEKWSKDGQRVNEMLFAGNSLARRRVSSSDLSRSGQGRG
jgi:hypothetical protein